MTHELRYPNFHIYKFSNEKGIDFHRIVKRKRDQSYKLILTAHSGKNTLLVKDRLGRYQNIPYIRLNNLKMSAGYLFYFLEKMLYSHQITIQDIQYFHIISCYSGMTPIKNNPKTMYYPTSKDSFGKMFSYLVPWAKVKCYEDQVGFFDNEVRSYLIHNYPQYYDKTNIKPPLVEQIPSADLHDWKKWVDLMNVNKEDVRYHPVIYQHGVCLRDYGHREDIFS